jgi:uncharacterized protein
MLAIAGLPGSILSGLIMTALIEGREGVGDLLRRVVLWRVGLQWYLFALLGLPVVMLLGTLVRPGALGPFELWKLSSHSPCQPTCSGGIRGA